MDKQIIGMIHLSGPDVVNKALEEISIYEQEGLYGIIVENYHSDAEDVERVLKALNGNTKMKVGVNILPNDYNSAFQLVSKYNADFIQLDFIAGKYLPNLQIDYKDLDESEMCGKFPIYGGVWPKYYIPIKDSNLRDDLEVACKYSDYVVVTGEGTGKETPLEKIKLFRETLDTIYGGNKKQLIVGAGLTSLNVREQLEFADGGIVGSAFKPNGRTHQMVDRNLVKKFMNEVKKI